MMLKTLCISFLLLSAVKVSALCDLGLKTAEEAKAYNYVIVPGIVNEIVPYYMTEYRRYLISMGVPKEQILRINNSTFWSPEESVEHILSELAAFKTKTKNNKKMVFIAHSKGALEILYTLMANREIDFAKAFLIQGALDGSSTYKALIKEKRKMWFFGLGRLLHAIPKIHDYTKSFDYLVVRENLKGISLESGLLSKLTFIESDTAFENLSYKFWYVGGFYRRFYGSSGDGILLRSDHVPYELRDKNICRRYYEADHGDLVRAAPWNGPQVKKNRDFLNDLLFGFERNK